MSFLTCSWFLSAFSGCSLQKTEASPAQLKILNDKLKPSLQKIMNTYPTLLLLHSQPQVAFLCSIFQPPTLNSAHNSCFQHHEGGLACLSHLFSLSCKPLLTALPPHQGASMPPSLGKAHSYLKPHHGHHVPQGMFSIHFRHPWFFSALTELKTCIQPPSTYCLII